MSMKATFLSPGNIATAMPEGLLMLAREINKMYSKHSLLNRKMKFDWLVKLG